MPHRPHKHLRELVHPDRERLRTLRDQYMRDMDATSYDEVRNKFLEELNSKRAPGESRRRERGAGVWNSAFAQKGLMLRSSIVLLAEFFGIEPEEIIHDPSHDSTASPAAEDALTADASKPPPEPSPCAAPAAPSVFVQGLHHQVIVAGGDLRIHGSLINAPLSKDPPNGEPDPLP